MQIKSLVMNILVIGGAGFIGSHMVKFLHNKGCKVTTLDDFSSGRRNAVHYGNIVTGDFGNTNILNNILQYNFDAVFHFASSIQVGESVNNPQKYYHNNFVNTINLLSALKNHGIMKIIFSSTAAIFGNPVSIPIDENHPQNPLSPYGRSKMMVEQVLADYDRAYGLKYVSLRYFNAAGADPEGDLGECHQPETHLIPLILQAASGRIKSINLYGSDYKTNDGTCVRDYIHVNDLCSAHWLALESLMSGCESQSYNLGNGIGFSVKEVIEAAERVTLRKIPVVELPRREGDPDILVADSKFAHSRLGWSAKYSDISLIINHAWNWENKLSAGYIV